MPSHKVSLINQLKQDMKNALKEKDKQKLTTIRMVISAVRKEEIDQKKSLDDAQVLEVIIKEIKQRKDALNEYEKAGRDDLAEKEKTELTILEAYLPEKLTEEELKTLILQEIEKIGAQSPKEMGKVMQAVMPRVKGKADGKMVNHLVQQLLQ